MKNWMKGLAAGVLVLGLAACGETAEPKTDPETGKKAEIKNESKMTAQEVFKKSVEASADQKSMHAQMDIDQLLEVPSQDLKMNSKIKMDMDMIVEPLSMYQKMQMDMGEQGSMDTEMYMTEEGFFMYEPTTDQWMILPSELVGEMGGEADPTLDMEMFNDFVDDFTFEQTEDEYVLKLKASGEKFNTLLKEVAMQNLPEGLEEGTEEAEILENMEVKSLEYEIFIDKKTFQTNAFNMDIDMTMGIDEEETHIVQKMKAQLSKINEIEKIEIPQEVLDKAVDMNELMGQ
ncbi:DUF6612 family protein [Sporosarcina sp. FSL K6-1522]|uniref:DUF6612 family protein n=1 Tax=Sporosarcina sp. FSL K6-1522 TaxID=2921554 RepID=UPI00315A9BD7